MKISESIARYRTWLRDEGNTKVTIASYGAAVRRLTELIGDIELGALNEEVLEEARRKCFDDLGNSARTVAWKVSIWKSFCHWVTKKAKLLDHNPSADLRAPKFHEPRMTFLREIELKRVMLELDAHCESSDASPSDFRDRAALSIAFMTGLRSGQVANIMMDQFVGIERGLEEYEISTLGKGQKYHTVWLSRSCVDRVCDWLEVRDQLNPKCGNLLVNRFGERMSRFSLLYVMKKWTARAAVTPINFHGARHTFGTLQMDLNTNVHVLKEMMGHRNIQSTDKYAHGRTRMVRAATQKLERVVA